MRNHPSSSRRSARVVVAAMAFLALALANSRAQGEDPSKPSASPAERKLTRADIHEMRPTDLLSGSFVLPFAAHVTDPGEFGLPFELVRFPNRGGSSLAGWFLDHKGTDRTILVCMGNTGNMSYMLFYARMLYEAGFDVLLFDYQGFGASDGVASVLSIAGDAEAAWRYLRETRKLEPDSIGVLGISLGSVLALMVASREGETPRAVVVEDVFRPADFLDQLRAMVKENFALRAGLMMAERTVLPAIDPMENLAKIDCPTLLVHGEEDWLLPPAGTIGCASAAAGPARVWLVPEVGHAPETLVAVDREYEHQLTSFFAEAFSDDPVEVVGCSFDVPSAKVNVEEGGKQTVGADVVVEVDRPKPRRPVLVTLSNEAGRTAHLRIYTDAPVATRTIRLDFFPSRADAIEYGHVTDQGDGTWVEDLSDYARDYRAWRAAERSVLRDGLTLNVRFIPIGGAFARVRESSPEYWEQLREQLPDPASVDERVRPHWAEILAQVALGLPDEAQRIAAARRVLDYLPADPLRHYTLGNAKLGVGFEDRAVAFSCRVVAHEAAQEGDIEEARRCLGLYLDLLPLRIEPGIDRAGVSAIEGVDDFDF